MESSPQNKGEKFKLQCHSCHKEVEVVVTSFGSGWIATCPDCGKLAYNQKSKPSSI